MRKTGVVMAKSLVVATIVALGISASHAAVAGPHNLPAPVVHPARATIVVAREFGLSCYNSVPLTVFVDGRAETRIGGGQSTTFQVPAGRYEIGIAVGDDAATVRSVPVDVSPGRRAVLRADLSASGYRLTPTG